MKLCVGGARLLNMNLRRDRGSAGQPAAARRKGKGPQRSRSPRPMIVGMKGRRSCCWGAACLNRPTARSGNGRCNNLHPGDEGFEPTYMCNYGHNCKKVKQDTTSVRSKVC